MWRVADHWLQGCAAQFARLIAPYGADAICKCRLHFVCIVLPGFSCCFLGFAA
jgi:hypothetical protein